MSCRLVPSIRVVQFLSLVTVVCWPAQLAELRADEAADAFVDGVADIFARRCLKCHNSIDHKGDFSLQTAEELFDSGLVEPGDAAGSELIEAITPQGKKRAEMPKGAKPLEADEIAVIRDWINAGAKWPDGFSVEEPVVRDFNWWSFKPMRRVDVPNFESSPEDAAWIRTPIDAFILEKLKSKGLTPSREADRRTLIRRVTYDLIGLPPTPLEVESFVNDRSPAAFAKVVDRLLASPHYGERWARHWLDVVRYGDDQLLREYSYRALPHAWRYRDWVVRAFNDDLPYDRFVIQQIAGDLLKDPSGHGGVVAVGLLALGL
ncbi:MAG: DUF1549 domain-containing protein, partial [Pirellulales bacterium]